MRSTKTVVFALLLAGMLNFTLIPKGFAASLSEVKIYSTDGKLVTTFTPFKDLNGVAGSVLATDLGTDGVSEIIVGGGKGLKPIVRIFRQDGSKITEFEAYAKGFTGGVTVAACDLDADGKSEIITGTGYTGGPHVRVFKNDGTFSGTQFFAFDAGQRGGVNVACGDVDADGRIEIIAGSGLANGKSVKVFSKDGVLESETSITAGDEKSGVSVTAANVDTDAALEILAMPMSYGNYDLAVLDRKFGGYKETVVETNFTSATYGSSVTALNGEIYIANGAYLAPQVQNLTTTTTFAPFDGATGFGTLIDAIEEKNSLVTVSSPTTLSPEASGQYIKVDLSEQKMTVYENGIEIKSFLVSTGKRGFSTPQGKTTVLAKIPVMTYAWSYGPNNPNNYYLPGVKWNLRFRKHYYIHSAYWHNNFGTPMSHGCVNMSVKDSEWVYNWAQVGATVEIVP